MNLGIKDLEYAKFEDVDGRPAVRVYIAREDVSLHSALQELDYASSGHTGFEPTITKGDITATTPLIISGESSGALIGAGVNVEIVQASSSAAGYLSSEDYSKFTEVYNTLAIGQDPTGFRYPDTTVVTYNSTDRTITLTGDVEAYFNGKLIPELVDGWVSTPHDAASGTYFLLYNGTNVVWSTVPWDFTNTMIALVFRDTANFCLRECHGLMDWESHREFHQTTGTYLVSGGDFSNFTLASTTATNRRPFISQTKIADEDLITTNSALNTNEYSWLFLTGADVANFSVDNAEIISLSTNQPFYNQFTGGNWQQTLFPTNAYGKIYILAIPVTADVDCQKLRFVFIQPQTVSTSLPTIQALTPSSVNLGHIGVALAEYVFIGEIIIRYTSNNWQLIEVNKLTGSRQFQASTPSGAFLSTVSSDATQFTGDGTAGAPLTLQPALPINSLIVGAAGVDQYVMVPTDRPTDRGIFFQKPSNVFDFAIRLIAGDGTELQINKNGMIVTPVGTIRSNTGTAAAPSFSNRSDTNTGLNLRAPDIAEIVTGGVERLTVFADGRIATKNIHNSAGSIAGITDQFLASGTFTPELFAGANASNVVSFPATYIRVGNVVHVSGAAGFTITTSGVSTVVESTIPIPMVASTGSFNLNGLANSGSSSTSMWFIGFGGATPPGRAIFLGTPSANGAITVFYTYSYEIR
jgi:hypothetical protein